MMYRFVYKKSVTVPCVSECCHISRVTSDRVWISGDINLILTNTKGVELDRVTDIGNGWGGHSVNCDGNLIYIDSNYNIIKLCTENKLNTTIVKYSTAPWRPLSVYSSPSRDLLVGMYNDYTNTGKVVRYNSKGKQIQTIQHGITGQRLLSIPNYISENRNGDVIVSEWNRVVVTDRDGKYRFSYRRPPSGSGLRPRGICTDALSHILVCDCITRSVQMLDRDGNFLIQVQTPQHGIYWPRGLSYDDEKHELWVGSDNNTVNIYGVEDGDSLKDTFVSTVGLPSRSPLPPVPRKTSAPGWPQPQPTQERPPLESTYPWTPAPAHITSTRSTLEEVGSISTHRIYQLESTYPWVLPAHMSSIRSAPEQLGPPSTQGRPQLMSSHHSTAQSADFTFTKHPFQFERELDNLPSGSSQIVQVSESPPPRKLRRTGHGRKLQKKVFSATTHGAAAAGKIADAEYLQQNEEAQEEEEDVKPGKLTMEATFEKLTSSHKMEEDGSSVIIIDDDDLDNVGEEVKMEIMKKPNVVKDISGIKSILNKEFRTFVTDKNDESARSRRDQRVKFRHAPDGTQKYVNSLIHKNKAGIQPMQRSRHQPVHSSRQRTQQEGSGGCRSVSSQYRTPSESRAVEKGPCSVHQSISRKFKAVSRMNSACGSNQNRQVKVSGRSTGAESDHFSQFFKHPLKWNPVWFVESDYRNPLNLHGIPTPQKNSFMNQIDDLKSENFRKELESLLRRIEYVDCFDICGSAVLHYSSGKIETCNEFSTQGIFGWTKYCTKKIREARMQKCKCFISTYCVLITIKVRDILANVKVKKLHFFVRHLVDFAIESRNYILLSELVRSYAFQCDFQLEAIFMRTSKKINAVIVETILKSAEYIILRKRPSLLQNSIQLSLCHDCEKGKCVTIVLSFKGTIEMTGITQEMVMGKKMFLYNCTNTSDEAYSVFKSYASSHSKETLPIISEEEARVLFKRHSNLTMISASSYKSIGYSKRKHRIVKKSCILLLCLHKGYIPYGEEEFPRKIRDVKVDVQEGFCRFGKGESLEIGGDIRRRGSKSIGTIGGFVNLPGSKIGLITCAHVVLSQKELEKREIDHFPEVEAFINSAHSYKVCGKVINAEFPKTDDCHLNPLEGSSVDAALIELTSSSSGGRFLTVTEEQLRSAGFQADKPPKFHGRIVPLLNLPNLVSDSVVKYGVTTGLTLGCLFNECMHVRINSDNLTLPDILGSTNPRSITVYNQMEIEGIRGQFFDLGDSGSFVFCINQDETLSCIGMAIGYTSRGTCLVTPIENVLKSLKLPVTSNCIIPVEVRSSSSAKPNTDTMTILNAITQMKSDFDKQQKDMEKRLIEQQKDIKDIKEKFPNLNPSQNQPGT